jgi:hypothetical protein
VENNEKVLVNYNACRALYRGERFQLMSGRITLGAAFFFAVRFQMQYSGGGALYEFYATELGVLIFLRGIALPFMIIVGMLYLLIRLHFSHMPPYRSRVVSIVPVAALNYYYNWMQKNLKCLPQIVMTLNFNISGILTRLRTWYRNASVFLFSNYGSCHVHI